MIAHESNPETDDTTPARPRSRAARWRRRLTILVAGLVLLACLGVILLTDSAPRLGSQPAPTAEQVGAGRDAVDQLLAGQQNVDGVSRLRIGPAHLDGIGAMASYGYRPFRLKMSAAKGILHVAASQPLPMGRWLNIDLDASAVGKGFPQIRIDMGSLSFSPAASRRLLDAALWIVRRRGIDLPPLDSVVRSFAVDDRTIAATVRLPIETILQHETAGGASRVDPATVAGIFCRLTAAQKRDPQADFAIQVRRAFSVGSDKAATADRNRAAFVALAMFTVDRRVGELAKVSSVRTAKCTAASPVAITLHGRADSPQHWSLSAALAAITGVQLAEAMGDWKELADSLSPKSEFQPGDPTGFSFLDIAADRSGFYAARAAIAPAGAGAMARRLSSATQAQILPPSLLGTSDGLTAGQFAAQYGSIDDPRFVRTVRGIDGILLRDGLAGPRAGP